MDNKKLLATIEKLREIRVKEDLTPPPCKILNTHLSNGVELKLRQYQIQGVLHLLAMPRFVLGDDTGLGKTLQTIATLSYLWDKRPDIPALICTTKSAVGQWEAEFEKFTTGVKVFKCLGTKKKREKIHNEFKAFEGPKAIIMGYRTAVQDFQLLQDITGHVMIFDEATAFKNDRSQVHQVCKHLAGSAERVWSLSATIIKNRLMEAWAIYKVTVPHLFSNKTHFMREYCITRDQTIPGSRRRIKIVVGHRKRDIEAFREHIDPYFLG